MKRLLPLIFLSLVVACSKSSRQADAPEAEVVPLYSYIASGHVPDSDSTVLRAFMRTVSEEPLTPELVEAWMSSQAVSVFTPDVDSVFTDTAYVARSLGGILANAESQGLALPRRLYATVVYGRPESVLFVDSVMLVALNHYLGADYPGYSHWPVYMRLGKTPQALPYDLAEALVATSYPYSLEGGDATALSRMIYEGVLTHAKMSLVPDGSLGDALGYTDAQMRWLEENEGSIWRSIIHRQLLYDTSESTADRLVAPSPEVSVVEPAAPGRVGRYIGSRIVSAYLADHPDATLPQMLSPEFYKGNSVLINSQYQH